MKPLIDADVLRYEIGACGQVTEEDGSISMRDFDFVADLLDAKIKEICELSWADESPTLFLTCCPATHQIIQRRNGTPFKPNFREKVAVSKPYKGTRKQAKPLHYKNITAYLLNNYDCIVAEGLEADDMLSIYQTKARKEGRETIICSRDKDLRMVEGNHFSWECGFAPGFGPKYVTRDGELRPVVKDEKVKGLKGEGLLFFCAQLLMGDACDNIPGLPNVGPVKAWDLLKDCKSYEEGLIVVTEAYKAKYADRWEELFLEQAHLLWMVRELDENNSPILFKLPEDL